LKTFSARQMNLLRRTPRKPVWQRDYYERVIRNEAELFKVRQYVANNPLQWALDAENPANIAFVSGKKPDGLV
jgi:REP-associated tyrosine transposase